MTHATGGLGTAPEEEQGPSSGSAQVTTVISELSAAAEEEEAAARSCQAGSEGMDEAAAEEEAGADINMAAAAAGEAGKPAISARKAEEEEQDEVFVLVGTGDQNPNRWTPCKGRLLLIQLAKSGSAQTGTHCCAVTADATAAWQHCCTACSRLSCKS